MIEPVKPTLLIMGSGRSGNTLLRRLLMERARIYIPPETYLLPSLASYRVAGRGLPWAAVVDLVVGSFQFHPEFSKTVNCELLDVALRAKRWEGKRRNVVKLVNEIYVELGRQSGLEFDWIGDKTPVNTLRGSSVSTLFDKPCFVYLVRDGVDVCYSYKRAGIYKDFFSAAIRWRNSHIAWASLKRKLSQDRYVEIRYEDLVRDPEATIDRLIAHLGIPKRDEFADVTDKLGDVSLLSHHGNVVTSPNPGSIGKGRREVSDQEIHDLRPLLNRWLKIWGYEEI